MNTLIISTFSCTFEEFKKDVTTLFLEEMCKDFVTDYEFVKVNEHKSHLLMNCTDLEKLGAEMESPFAKEWDKKIIVRISSIRLSLLNNMKRFLLPLLAALALPTAVNSEGTENPFQKGSSVHTPSTLCNNLLTDCYD